MMDAIVKSLRAAIGLDVSSIGIGAVERAVQQRMAAASLTSVEEYRRRLEERPDEMRALIETVVVPETWFFRDPGAFAAAAQSVQRADPSVRAKFLCVPCATGEEPYSLAMSLLDAGLPPERFEIEAVDVSRRVVEQALEAVYGRNSFRGPMVGFRDRYFRKTDTAHALDPVVRKLVRFRQANLLEDFTLHPSGVYHGIFCRNLLIYFDDEMQTRALSTLRRLLSPDGLLFVAPAESGLMLRHEFSPAGMSQAFAFRKAAARKASPPPAVRPASVSLPPLPPPIAIRPAPIAPVAPTPSRSASRIVHIGEASAPTRKSSPLPDLTEVTRLANEGRLDEVSTICQEFLKTHTPSADVYCLLGLVADASERPDEAAGFYRKALYLDPQHRDALSHYALLAQRMGDIAAAEALRRRAARLENNTIAK